MHHPVGASKSAPGDHAGVDPDPLQLSRLELPGTPWCLGRFRRTRPRLRSRPGQDLAPSRSTRHPALARSSQHSAWASPPARAVPCLPSFGCLLPDACEQHRLRQSDGPGSYAPGRWRTTYRELGVSPRQIRPGYAARPRRGWVHRLTQRRTACSRLPTATASGRPGRCRR